MNKRFNERIKINSEILSNSNKQRVGCTKTVFTSNLDKNNKKRFFLSFRCKFSGILVHFDDTLLSNYFFLDPQYLAEILAQILINEQTNGLSRHGLMKISELFNNLQEDSMLNSFIVPLLQKFDLAITWDNQHLIFPPLLPERLNMDAMVDFFADFELNVCFSSIFLNFLSDSFSVESKSRGNHFVHERRSIFTKH